MKEIAAFRKLKSKSGVDGDAEWNRIINDPRPKPKFAAALKRLDKLIRQGKDQPFDFGRL
jgi:hypothetical protein